jgi:hypothetical protein
VVVTCGDPPYFVGDVPSCTCGPYWSIIPPGPCPVHQGNAFTPLPFQPLVPAPQPPIQVVPFPLPEPRELTDAEIDRIADRLAAKLWEKWHE